MDKIIIKDLAARGIIGVNDWERKAPQEILINVWLYTDCSAAGESDDIADTISYSTVAKKILACAETSNRFTVEALAADISRLCLEFPGVSKVRVRVEKPGIVRFTGSVGVEIERQRLEE